MNAKSTFLALSLSAFFFAGLAALATNCRAEGATTTIVKKANLPALKGGKVKKTTDGIPSCSVGRAKGDWGLVSEEEFSKFEAKKHPCVTADTIYVCRAGANLSVRCE